MGVTIHYKGAIRDMAQLPKLTARLKSACRQLNWPYQEINERILGTIEIMHDESDPEEEDTSNVVTESQPVDDRWQGLVIGPPDCDALHLTFNRAGRLVIYHAQFDSSPGTYCFQESMFCKTQFGQPETHIAICDLLHQAQPYMADWQVNDEGGYWESGDRDELVQRMKYLGSIIEHLGSELGRDELEGLVGQEIEGKVKTGKTITEVPPIWRKGWGESASEN